MKSDFEEYRYRNELTMRSKLKRFVWNVTSMLLFRPTPSFCCYGWRLFLFRFFGGSAGVGCRIDPSVKIWAPWNVRMGDYVCLARDADIYSVSLISIGSKVTVSQRAFLCTASHDIRTLQRPLIHRPIVIQDHVWICAEAFVGPGVTLGEGAVVAARAVVMHDVVAWKIVGGNPAKLIKDRELEEGGG